jgi:polyhydroxybutyrate depolymerase
MSSLHQSLLAFCRALALLASGVSVLLAVAAARSATGTEGLDEHTATLGDGRDRRWFVYRPERIEEPADIVFVLHGSGGNAARVRALTARRFETLADEHGFVVIYPEGFEGNWNGCRRPAPFSANRLGVDDVGFLRELRERHAGNGGRVLAFGFSGGAHMALRLALEAPDVADAVAVVGAGLPAAEDNDCTPVAGAIGPAVMLVNGTADPINPYEGGEIVLPPELGGISLGRVLSSRETAAWLARRAGHRSAASHARGDERDGNPATAVAWSRWAGAGLPEVAHLTIEGGGHTIPLPGTRFPALLGPHSEDVDVPAEAWLFFDGGTRPRRGPSP